MKVTSIHERVLPAPAAMVGELLDGLASSEDRLWPRDRWPAMRFDRPLGVGAVGGHGPIGYSVASYEPGSRIEFRFTRPKGYLGGHWFEVEEVGEGRTLLRHTIEMRLQGLARLGWPLVVRPLHDALLRDALDRGERQVGGQPGERRWSSWVRLLRWLMGRQGRSPRVL